MDPLVEAALISAGATVVGVGGIVIVAIAGFRNSRSTNQAAINAARETSKETIEAEIANLQRTLDTGREGQLADRYSRAIEQVGSDKLDVRIGGIYALERVAVDSARDHPTVMEVLSAFLREHSHDQQASSPRPDPDLPGLIPDLQAALDVIGRRDVSRDTKVIGLWGVQCSGAYLRDANFSKVSFLHADLGRAIFVGSQLRRAVFAWANLAGATLVNADLSHANVGFANLTVANLSGVNLTGANLAKAKLIGADLSGADLTSARLEGADLTGAKLLLANFTDAYLAHADLPRADITDAKFDGADLTDSWFPTGAQIPEGWETPAGSGRLARFHG